jgi:hypothetical protein
MKTPMQELMDELAKKADSLPNTLDANVAYLVFQECYDMAKSMLTKEKSMIEDIHSDARFCQVVSKMTAEEFYNETFNTKE